VRLDQLRRGQCQPLAERDVLEEIYNREKIGMSTNMPQLSKALTNLS
jgi:hypothetical protein